MRKGLGGSEGGREGMGQGMGYEGRRKLRSWDGKEREVA